MGSRAPWGTCRPLQLSLLLGIPSLHVYGQGAGALRPHSGFQRVARLESQRPFSDPRSLTLHTSPQSTIRKHQDPAGEFEQACTPHIPRVPWDKRRGEDTHRSIDGSVVHPGLHRGSPFRLLTRELLKITTRSPIPRHPAKCSQTWHIHSEAPQLILVCHLCGDVPA